MGLKSSAPESVLITGASTGIGEACALRLDGLGFRVFAGVRNDADGECLQAKASARLSPVLLDVTQPATVATAAGRLTEMTGEDGLAGVMSNAGIALGGPIEFLSLDTWRAQFEVNVFGALSVTQAFLPLIRRGHGRVVFIGSISGRFASPFISPYCASKYALEAIADSLRFELRPWQIDVAIVEPGSVATPLWGKAEDTLDRLKHELPAEALSLYGPAIAAIEEFTKEAGKRGVAADDVAKAVQHALTAKRPKTRYLVGADARIQAAAAMVLSDRMLDRLIQMQLGVGRKGAVAASVFDET